jgi:hypothetical protein
MIPPGDLTICTGKGTQAPKIKEKFGCCHLVSLILVYRSFLSESEAPDDN